VVDIGRTEVSSAPAASPSLGPLQRFWREYSVAAAFIAVAVAGSCWLARGPSSPVEAGALVRPMLALFGLTALVWLTMVVARNAAVLRGTASVRYFVAYQAEFPGEHIERPARAFDNLMQVPMLFYIVCLLMLVTQRADAQQAALAWAFVVLRAVHAALFITLNRVPLRFASWISSCVALGLLWYRFAALYAGG